MAKKMSKKKSKGRASIEQDVEAEMKAEEGVEMEINHENTTASSYVYVYNFEFPDRWWYHVIIGRNLGTLLGSWRMPKMTPQLLNASKKHKSNLAMKSTWSPPI